MTKEDIKAAAEKEFPLPELKPIPEIGDAMSRAIMVVGQEGFERGAEHVLKEMEWKDVTKELPQVDESTKFDFGYKSKTVLVLINGGVYLTEYAFYPDKSKCGWS